MHIVARLVASSYIPSQLEEGMLFYSGGEFRQIHTVPLDEQEFIKLNGFPVELYIIDEGNPNLDELQILAHPEQIGWWDEGDHSDELYDITLKELNNIVDNDGFVEIEMEEDEEGYLVPLLMEDKVVLRYVDDDE